MPKKPPPKRLTRIAAEDITRLDRLGRYSDKLVKAELTRQLKTTERRLEAFKKAGYYEANYQTSVAKLYASAGGDTTNAAAIPAENRRAVLSQLARINRRKRAYVREETRGRKRELKTLHGHGFTFINMKNFPAWRSFMHEATEMGLKKSWGSARLYEAFVELETHEIDQAVIWKYRSAFEEYLRTHNLNDLIETINPKKEET